MLGLILGGSHVMALAAVLQKQWPLRNAPGVALSRVGRLVTGTGFSRPGAAARIVRHGAIGARLRPTGSAPHTRESDLTRERQKCERPGDPVLRGSATRYLLLHRSGRSLATGRGYSMSFCFLISDVVSAAIAPTSRGMLSGL
jgi:hypothetical protein